MDAAELLVERAVLWRVGQGPNRSGEEVSFHAVAR
jgi:hypothetical protein